MARQTKARPVRHAGRARSQITCLRNSGLRGLIVRPASPVASFCVRFFQKRRFYARFLGSFSPKFHVYPSSHALILVGFGRIYFDSLGFEVALIRGNPVGASRCQSGSAPVRKDREPFPRNHQLSTDGFAVICQRATTRNFALAASWFGQGGLVRHSFSDGGSLGPLWPI